MLDFDGGDWYTELDAGSYGAYRPEHGSGEGVGLATSMVSAKTRCAWLGVGHGWSREMAGKTPDALLSRLGTPCKPDPVTP